MPNKTIYVAEADLPIFDRAQQLTGANLSATIVGALQRLIDAEEARAEGFEEITVQVGPGRGRRQRFSGVLLADWNRTTKSGREDRYRVYRTRNGRFALHLAKSADYVWTAGPDGKATGLRKAFASEQQYGTVAPMATLEVVDTLEELRALVPDEIYQLVAAAAEQPPVEDLDI